MPRSADSFCTCSFPGISSHGEALKLNTHISMSSESWEIGSSLQENLPACHESLPDQSLPCIIFPGFMAELPDLDWSYICTFPLAVPGHQSLSSPWPQALKLGERICQVKVSFSPNSWKRMDISRRKLEFQDGLYHLSQGWSFSTGNVGMNLSLDGSEEGVQNADVRQSASYIFLPKHI